MILLYSKSKNSDSMRNFHGLFMGDFEVLKVKIVKKQTKHP